MTERLNRTELKRKIRTDRAKKTMRIEIVLSMENLMLPTDAAVINKSGPCQESGFPGSASGKETACLSRRHQRHAFDPWVGQILWRRKWQPTPVFLPGKSHGQRSLEGYSPGSQSWT